MCENLSKTQWCCLGLDLGYSRNFVGQTDNQSRRLAEPKFSQVNRLDRATFSQIPALNGLPSLPILAVDAAATQDEWMILKQVVVAQRYPRENIA